MAEQSFLGKQGLPFPYLLAAFLETKTTSQNEKTKLNNNKQTENLLILGLDLGGVMARVLSEYGQGMLHEILEELIAYLLIV